MKDVDYGCDVLLETQTMDVIDSHISKHAVIYKFLKIYYSNTVLASWIRALTVSGRITTFSLSKNVPCETSQAPCLQGRLIDGD